LENYSYEGSGPGSLSYEAYGPSSVASSNKSGTSEASGEYVERKDESGCVMRDEKGNIIKWKVRKRAGHRGRVRRTVGASRDESTGMLVAVENATTLNDEDEDVYDDRIGDAEDRVIDIGHLLSTGEDIDTADLEYKTSYTTVKAHKTFVQKYFSCIVRKKKRKKIGY
jgi:hypothetical protein